MTTLASLVIVDKVQPQTAAYMTATSRNGLVTRPGVAMAVLTMMPTVSVEEAMDIALKRGDVRLSFLQMDSRVGFLAIQSQSISELRDVVDAIIDEMRLELPADEVKTVHSRLVSRLDANQAYVTNMMRMGSLAIPGDTLFVVESDPSAYALVAVNEAEKAAELRLVDFKFTGSMGRMIVSGKESDIRAAKYAIEQAAEAMA